MWIADVALAHPRSRTPFSRVKPLKLHLASTTLHSPAVPSRGLLPVCRPYQKRRTTICLKLLDARLRNLNQHAIAANPHKVHRNWFGCTLATDTSSMSGRYRRSADNSGDKAFGCVKSVHTCDHESLTSLVFEHHLWAVQLLLQRCLRLAI